jgi:DNA-binding GntR family transcriptional regulator
LFLPKTLAQGQIAVDKHRTMFDASLARDTKTAKAVLETPIRNGLDHALSAMTDSNT